MKGKLYIDGIDAYAELGVFVAQGGYSQLVQMPPFKSVDSTEWPEENLSEYDLTSPVLDARNISVPFYASSKEGAVFFFGYLLGGNPYKIIKFEEIKKEFMLRGISLSGLTSVNGLCSFKLTFSDDFPVVPDGGPSDSSITRHQGWSIDGMDLSRFGMIVLKGTADNLFKQITVRQKLITGNKITPGIVYDDAETHNIKQWDFTLKLHVSADDINDFWTRYNGLFNTLMQPEKRTIWYEDMNQEYDCFYKSCKVSRFELINGMVWCDFDITFTQTI